MSTYKQDKVQCLLLFSFGFNFVKHTYVAQVEQNSVTHFVHC